MRLRGGILAHMPATAANLSQVVGDYASLVLHDLIDGQGVAGDVLHDAPLEEVVSPRAHHGVSQLRRVAVVVPARVADGQAGGAHQVLVEGVLEIPEQVEVQRAQLRAVADHGLVSVASSVAS